MTQLPTRLHPRTDESFYGYVARLSHALSIPAGLVLLELGLLPGERAGWGCLLRDADLVDVADALNLAPKRVKQLTLRRYQHLLPMPSPRQWHSLGGWASTHSVLLRGGRFCPDCLREDNTWKLAWRLPEQIGCRTHHRLLLHTCDKCQGPPNAGGARAEAGYLDYLHHPRFCYSKSPNATRDAGKHAPPCGRDLSRLSAKDLDSFQEHVSELVSRVHGGQVTTLAGRAYPAAEARRVLREALSLQGHAERARDPATVSGARLYRRVVVDANDVTQLLAACAEWLFSTNPDQAVRKLSDWMDSSTPGTPCLNTYRNKLGSEPVLQPQLLEALQRFGTPSSQANRLRTVALLPPDPYPQSLPQLAWTCALPAALRNSRSPNVRYIQATMSLQLARRHTVSWREAAIALDVPQAQQWKRNVYTKLGRQQQLPAFLAATLTLHYQLLSACPWRVADVSWDDRVAAGLTEGLCHKEGGAAWCPCMAPVPPLATGPQVS